jgi:hypothetical protein
MRLVKKSFETGVAEGKRLRQADNIVAATSASAWKRHRSTLPSGSSSARLARRPPASDPALDFDDLARNIKTGTSIYEVLALTEAEETALNDARVIDLQEFIRTRG